MPSCPLQILNLKLAQSDHILLTTFTIFPSCSAQTQCHRPPPIHPPLDLVPLPIRPDCSNGHLRLHGDLLLEVVPNLVTIFWQILQGQPPLHPRGNGPLVTVWQIAWMQFEGNGRNEREKMLLTKHRSSPALHQQGSRLSPSFKTL